MPAALRPWVAVAVVALAAALPPAGRALRSGGTPRCAFDGVAVPAASRVAASVEGSEVVFCCVECAAAWIARRPDAAADVRVTDAAGGTAVAAGAAWFVAGRVPVPGGAGSWIHAFAREEDARRHVAAFGGRVLEGALRPFPPRRE